MFSSNDADNQKNDADSSAESGAKKQQPQQSSYSQFSKAGFMSTDAAAKSAVNETNYPSSLNSNENGEIKLNELPVDAGSSLDPRDKYSINLMWLSKNINHGNVYICPSSNESELIDKLLGTAEKWKKANPDADVNIWYDGDLVTKAQLDATHSVLNTINPSIKLRNTRDIDIVRNNPDFFSPNIPIYIRVDVMKLILCIETLVTDGKNATIFSDLEVGDLRKSKDRMGKDELFKPEIMDKLNKFGIILGRVPMKVDNQYFQVLNNPKTILALQIMVDANLCRLATMFNLYLNSKPDGQHNNIQSNAQHKAIVANIMENFHPGFQFFALMDHMPKLLHYLYDPKQYPIEINTRVFEGRSNDEWVPYNPEVHRHLPFGDFFYLQDYYFVTDKSHLEKNIHVDDASRMPYVNLLAMTRDDISVRNGNTHPLSYTEVKQLENIKPANGTFFEFVTFNDLSKMSLSSHDSMEPRRSGMF